jgi:hypothetical protein
MIEIWGLIKNRIKKVQRSPSKEEERSFQIFCFFRLG